MWKSCGYFYLPVQTGNHLVQAAGREYKGNAGGYDEAQAPAPHPEAKRLLSLKDLENIETRANSAPLEMELAWQFDWVIPNHDGEDSENWNAFYYPVGDALKAVQAFSALLKNESTPHAEKWEKGLWPEE